MADTKISALTAATTPLAGTEVLPIVQSGVTKQVSVADLTAGRAVSALSLSLTNALTAANGGTGQSSYAIGDLLYASGTTALSKLADVATGNALISGGVGVAPSWGKIGLATHVSGTLGVANGGTGLSSATTGDLLYASGTNTWASLADVATGNALISGGVGVAPSWGKIGLTTHVSGTLPYGNGGTGLTSFTANGILYASSTTALATGSALTFDGTNFATTGTASATKLIPTGGTASGNGIWLPASNTVALSTNGSEAWRVNSSQQFLANTTSNSTGAAVSVNKGIGIQNDTSARFATVEYGSGANGTFTTITISFTVNSSNSSVMIEAFMTGYSGVYLDTLVGKYSNQASVTMRSNASAGTSAALTVDGTTTIYTLTITTSVTHPVVGVRCWSGALASTITLPTFTFA